MKPIELASDHTSYSPESILEQVDRICEDPLFKGSRILCKFLKFIVSKALDGDEHCLKEYTIARNVLNKPADFNTKENGIVRIHAVRLRKTLADYYIGPGAMDTIRISLPKGSYVPVFGVNGDHVLHSLLQSDSSKSPAVKDEHTWVSSVLPFQCRDGKKLVRTFSDGLGIQLTSSLNKVRHLSMTAYNVSRHIPDGLLDIREIGQLFHTSYLFTGDVLSVDNRVRVMVEMIRTDTGEQVWSEMFERTISESNSFLVQDDIISKVVEAVKRRTEHLVYSRPVISMSVA